MDMEVTAWTSLHSAINAQQDRRPLSRAGLRRVAAFARPHRRGLVLFLLLSVVTALLAVATPVLASRVVTAIVDGRDGATVTRLALLIALIAVAEAGLGLLARRLSATLGEGLILDLRTAVFDHVQRMPVAFFTRTRTGALVSRLNNDVIGAQRAFSNTLSGVVANTVTLLLTLAVMLSISWQITLLALVLLPVFVLPARRMGARMAAMQREASALNAAMGTQMTERFSAPGATLVKLFGRPADESAEFAVRAARVRDIGIRTAMAQSAFITALTLVSALALALVYGLGGYYALRGTLDAGSVVALALLLTRLYAPLTALAGARVEVMSAMVSFERVFEILDLKPLIAQLLPRLYDADAGAVRLGGVDVRDLTADSIRDTLGMVTQDGHLFHESVRANLLLARPDATEEDIWEALRRSRLDGLVASLPDGLDTVVGERGYRLSGGERQRLTIARLLLARQRVVVLDEATAHLDSTSEAAVQEALGEALAGRTAVVIAHRLSTVQAADQILVVEDGRIVERGTHTELLEAGGRYEELYRTQFAAADTPAGRESDGAAPVRGA
ncbi:ABC transporter ATP-binding protein [Streptomyces virginiae]|uniref:ABC transporter ATP-binding protein n=1 Tax=Streptomyces virginiae TaxID=1961 RepID=UPI0036CD0396